MLFENEVNMMNMNNMSSMNNLEHNRVGNSRNRTLLSSSQLCLLGIGLTLLVIVNLSLLLWVWFFIANLRITEPTSFTNQEFIGLDSTFLVGGDGMSVKTIQGSPNLHFKSPSGITIGPSKRLQSSLKADNSWLELTNDGRATGWADTFKIVSASDQRILMNVNEQITAFGFEHVSLTSSRRLSLNHSLQTPNLEQLHSSLHFISQNRKINVRTPKSMILQTLPSPSNINKNYNSESYEELSEQSNDDKIDKKIELSASKEISLSTERVTLSSEDVIFSERLLTVHSSKHGRTYPTVGQLCVCANSGLVFASSTKTDCLRSSQVCDQNQ